MLEENLCNLYIDLALGLQKLGLILENFGLWVFKDIEFKNCPPNISLIFDKCPDGVITSITTKPNFILQSLFKIH